MLVGFSITNHAFWVPAIYGNTQIKVCLSLFDLSATGQQQIRSCFKGWENRGSSHLVCVCSPRIDTYIKKSGTSHAIEDQWMCHLDIYTGAQIPCIFGSLNMGKQSCLPRLQLVNKKVYLLTRSSLTWKGRETEVKPHETTDYWAISDTSYIFSGQNRLVCLSLAWYSPFCWGHPRTRRGSTHETNGTWCTGWSPAEKASWRRLAVDEWLL